MTLQVGNQTLKDIITYILKECEEKKLDKSKTIETLYTNLTGNEKLENII
jgi:hypothetical protein